MITKSHACHHHFRPTPVGKLKAGIPDLQGGSDVPPPHDLLAERYEQEARWDLALGEFEKIIHYHPDELAAHAGRIRVVLHGAGDRTSARRYFKHSLRILNDAASRRLLRESWDSLSNEDLEAPLASVSP